MIWGIVQIFVFDRCAIHASFKGCRFLKINTELKRLESSYIEKQREKLIQAIFWMEILSNNLGGKRMQCNLNILSPVLRCFIEAKFNLIYIPYIDKTMKWNPNKLKEDIGLTRASARALSASRLCLRILSVRWGVAGGRRLPTPPRFAP